MEAIVIRTDSEQLIDFFVWDCVVLSQVLVAERLTDSVFFDWHYVDLDKHNILEGIV